MSSVLLSVSGRDRPGIVRDVAESLLHLQANIEDSSMTALRGQFTMMMIVRLPQDTALSELKAALADLERRTGLTVRSQPLSDEDLATQAPEPDYVITVHGADKVGIVHAVSEALATRSISIVDLSTRVRSSEQGDIYMMALEVRAGAQGKDLREAMGRVAERTGVDIDVHELDDELL